MSHIDDAAVADRATAYVCTPQQRHRAARCVASWAANGADAALILDCLGLGAAEGKSGSIREDE